MLTHGRSPEWVADQLDLSFVDVHTALAYHHDNVEAMSERREQHDELEARLEDVATPPPETAER